MNNNSFIKKKNSKTPVKLELGFVVDGKGGVAPKGIVERDICFG